MANARPISPRLARVTCRRSSLAVAPPHQRRQRDGQHQARQQAAGEQRRDRHTRDRADGDQHQARRDGLGLRAGRGEQGDQIARLGAPRLHFRKQHRRHGGHVGSLRARDARHQIHRANQHVMQPAADMAQQACQKRHHGARHARHLDQQTEKYKQRHRQQDQVAHALVHAADQHHQRRARGQRQIAIGRKPEPERNRNTGKDAEAGDADKEDDQIEITERLQRAPEQPEDCDDKCDREDRSQHGPEIARSGQPQEGKQRHQRNADRQRRGTPDIADLQRRRGDVAFLVGVFQGRPGDQDEKRQRGYGRHQIEIGAHGGLRAGDHRRHPHVLGAAERDRSTQHREPQEQDRRQFVRPDQRRVQRIARHHAGKQDDDFGDDQQRCRKLDQHPQRMFERRQQEWRRGDCPTSPPTPSLSSA